MPRQPRSFSVLCYYNMVRFINLSSDILFICRNGLQSVPACASDERVTNNWCDKASRYPFACSEKGYYLRLGLNTSHIRGHAGAPVVLVASA